VENILFLKTTNFLALAGMSNLVMHISIGV